MPKKKFVINKAIQAMDCNDPLSIFISTSSVYKSKRLVLEVLRKLKTESCENKMKKFFVELLRLVKNDLEMLTKIDSTVILFILKNIEVKHFFVEDVKVLIESTKITVDYAIEPSESQFFVSNFYNYYLYKKATNNYNFDITFPEKEINKENCEVFCSLFVETALQNAGNLEFVRYIGSIRNKEIRKDFHTMLYKRDRELYAAFVEQIAGANIESSNPQNINLSMKSGSQELSDESMLDATAINRKEIMESYKNYTCWQYSVDNVCEVCNRKAVNSHCTNAEQIDELLAKNLFVLTDIDNIRYVLMHKKELLTLKNLETIIKMSYKTNDIAVYQLYALFDFSTDNDFRMLIADLMEFMVDKPDRKNTVVMFNIISHIATLDGIFALVYKYLYTIFYTTDSKYMKIRIQLYLKDKLRYMYTYDSKLYDFIFGQAAEAESLSSVLQNTTALFDVQYDTFVLSALHIIAIYTYENDLFHLIEDDHVSMAEAFVLFDLKMKDELKEEYYFGRHISELKKKLAAKLVALALFYDINTTPFLEWLNIADICPFVNKNFVPIILTVKDIFLYYKIEYVCCVFQVLAMIVNILKSNNSCFNVKASSYIMYFVTEKIDEVMDMCKKLGHDHNTCKNDLFEILNLSLFNNACRSKIDTPRSQITKVDYVDVWYTNTMDLLLQEEKLYYFTINRIIEEFDNLLEKMKAVNAFSQKYGDRITKSNIDIVFLHLLKNNTHDFRNKFTKVHNEFSRKYGGYKESYSYIARTGVVALSNNYSIKRRNFLHGKTVLLSPIISNCIDYIYKSFDIENQEIYYYVMQQLIKILSETDMIENLSDDFIQHLRTSSYVYEGNFDIKEEVDLEFSNVHKTFVSNLFDYSLSLIHKVEGFCRFFEYGKLLDEKVQAHMLFYMLYYIDAENVEISINTHLFQQNLQKINRRTLKYILRLNSFCQNRLIDQDNAIKIALYLSDYYYLIRVYEHMHREGKRVDSILCSLYFLVSDYEKSKALNMQVKLISTVNVFFDLCLENEFDSARSCLANIYSDEIESALFNKMLEKIESESNDIEEIYKLSSDIREQYSTWNAMDNETRNINMHIAYDIDLITKNDLTTETLELIAMRHEISQHRSQINAKHLSLIDFMPYKQECTKLMKSKCFKEYRDYFTFDKIADMRKTGDLIQCKSKITSLLLDKNYDALYEYAKYKEHTGQTIDAIKTLEKHLYMSNGEGMIHKKSMLLHAQLSQDQKIFVDAVERYTTSETLFFQFGKYLEKLDPLASLEAYLKSLLYGTKYINESLLKILNLLCETKDEKYPKKSYKTMAEFYKKAGILAETYFSQINVNDYKYFIGQILSKLGHANKKINDVIVALVRNIIIADSFAISGWYIMFTFDKEAKDLHTEMIEILKSLPSEMHIKLKEFKALIEMLISISKFDAKGNKNIKIDETLKLNRKINFNIRVPSESWETYLQEINNDIYVYHSLQCPKRIALLGSNGKTYYFLCKSNDDLRKDARFMDLSRVMNIVLNNSRYTNNDNLYIRTYNIFVLRYSCGIIEWVPGLETLRNIIYPEYAKINLNVNDELKKHRTKKKVGDKSFQDVLKRFPPVLRNYFDSIIDPKTSFIARDKFTKTYAVMCVVGWFMGLGDRHLENIMIDVSTSDTFHVDLNCILNKAKKLEIPESVPFRLTQNIVDAFGVLKTEATFKSAMVKTLKTMIHNEELIMTTLQCIINDPFSEWKAKSKASLENINKALDEFRNKLRCDPDKMVDHLIDEAKDIHSLANMYIGWCSFV